MAEPTVTIAIRANSAWNTVVEGSDVIKFGGADSADGSITPVTVPASGNAKIADEMWWEDSDGTDYESDYYEYTTQEGDKTSGTPLSSITACDYLQFKVVGTSTSAGSVTLWDTTGHSSTSNEMLTDTTWSNHCWIIMDSTNNGGNVSDRTTGGAVASGYKSQTFGATTYEYKGSTTLSFDGGLTNQSDYIIIHAKIPDDASAGAHACVLTYTYYYT